MYTLFQYLFPGLHSPYYRVYYFYLFIAMKYKTVYSTTLYPGKTLQAVIIRIVYR